MGFRSFAIGIIWRVLVIVGLELGIASSYVQDGIALPAVVLMVLLVGVTFNLIAYGNTTNRKITRFLESIRYSDFSSRFTKDSKMGSSFREMNLSFNEVIDAFRKTRAEKEEQMLFLQIMIQHINTGILSFDSKGRIGVINGAAKQLLRIHQFKDIYDLGKLSTELLANVVNIKPGGSFSINVRTDLYLNVQSAAFKMDGNNWTLLSFQNIKSELQKNELQAWQNLTKVLRHEIMNSMTPIASLSNSLGTILEEDIQQGKTGLLELEKESYLDLAEGLRTISKRSIGLVNFVNAYRDYTNIPQPKLVACSLKALFDNCQVLLKEELIASNISLTTNVQPTGLEITADQELIQMILINLIKNAKEAMASAQRREIIVSGGLDSQSIPVIRVTDFGEGIVPEAVERIFVPFYTTKKTGSGIGLAISRQIMHLHHGTLEVYSEPEQQTTFLLRFG